MVKRSDRLVALLFVLIFIVITLAVLR